MPEIGGVHYTDEAFEHMRGLYGLQKAATDPAEARRLVGEGATMHEFHRQFPGLIWHGEPETLADPDANRIGKFQRPGDAAMTQREAAIIAYPRTGTARREVLNHIAQSDGVTDEEIQDALAMNPSTQRPRRVELVEGGWVCDSGRTRLTRSGTHAVVWVLTGEGSAHWRAV